MRSTLRLVALCCLTALLPGLSGAQPAPAGGPGAANAPGAPNTERHASPLVDQVGSTGFIVVRAPSFAALPLAQKLVAYHLAQAAIQLDPIFYDQMSTYGLAAKQLLTALVEDPRRLPADSRDAIVAYAKVFLANKGNHDNLTGNKIQPAFSYDQLAAAAAQARTAGAPLGAADTLAATLRELREPLFDPAYQPSVTAKHPTPPADILTASGNNYYQGVSMADLAGFTERYGLDSRLVKRDGRLVEEVWRAGTPDGKVPPGMYARQLAAVNRELEEAATHAETAQAQTLRALVRFYQTGDLNDWRDFNVLWVRTNPPVDLASGFIEVYHDARGVKGSAQMLVAITDQRLDPLMHELAANAPYFERRAPWEDRFKKLDVKPPVGRAIETVIATGDFSVGTIGDNLPNEQDFREQYGTKSVLLTSSMNAFNEVTNRYLAIEFCPNRDEAQLFDRYGKTASDLLTAMHEVIGHGSGKVVVPKDPSTYLREYYSTLEEARADLVAYWNVTDPKLAELGIRDTTEVAHEMYRNMARAGITALSHYPTGDSAEEDHDRDRLLIANYLIDAGALARIQRDGHWYIEVKDYDRAHAAVGKLLAEIMRIKATGDYAAIKALVDKYGIHFDPAVRDDVIARYKRLQRPTSWAGVFPALHLQKDSAGHVTDVTLSYDRSFLAQEIDEAKANGTFGPP